MPVAVVVLAGCFRTILRETVPEPIGEPVAIAAEPERSPPTATIDIDPSTLALRASVSARTRPRLQQEMVLSHERCRQINRRAFTTAYVTGGTLTVLGVVMLGVGLSGSEPSSTGSLTGDILAGAGYGFAVPGGILLAVAGLPVWLVPMGFDLRYSDEDAFFCRRSDERREARHIFGAPSVEPLSDFRVVVEGLGREVSLAPDEPGVVRADLAEVLQACPLATVWRAGDPGAHLPGVADAVDQRVATIRAERGGQVLAERQVEVQTLDVDRYVSSLVGRLVPLEERRVVWIRLITRRRGAPLAGARVTVRGAGSATQESPTLAAAQRFAEELSVLPCDADELLRARALEAWNEAPAAPPGDVARCVVSAEPCELQAGERGEVAVAARRGASIDLTIAPAQGRERRVRLAVDGPDRARVVQGGATLDVDRTTGALVLGVR